MTFDPDSSERRERTPSEFKCIFCEQSLNVEEIDNLPKNEILSSLILITNSGKEKDKLNLDFDINKNLKFPNGVRSSIKERYGMNANSRLMNEEVKVDTNLETNQTDSSSGEEAKVIESGGDKFVDNESSISSESPPL